VLKEQILSLLQADADEGESDFLKHTPNSRQTIQLTEKPGDRIGRYKLLQKIGEGGCGVVYMADQEEPVRRRVAFKVIKLGMDTKQVVARFEAEGQALAMMDHPNIAKVFDAGATNTGRPYFVMELVRGIKITEYCDQNNLPTEERLKLFTQVCHAIQHAHQKGIIHRDIKPSNILVTVNDGVPVPKVIDFGIAKAIEQRLTDKTVFTAFEQFIGTPAYMSPEQAEMTSLDIDTRADIYSLGVLLYELLSGNTPFDAETLVASGVAEIRRIIREQEPPKPSTRLNTLNRADLSTVAQHRHTDPPRLMHLIRGDLDWIVMKCLEKDRTRRYETANGLAMDLQRHLDNEPVVARPPSNLYRFQKLVRRNKLAFAASAAVLLVLLGGIAASTWQAIRATRAEREQTRLRGQAESEAAKSRQVAQFMKDMMGGVGPAAALGRDTTMLREILDQTAKRLKDLKTQPAVEADLRATLGNVYSDLAEYTNAAAMHREALALRKKLMGNEHADVAASLNNLSGVLWRQGRAAEAETMYRETLAMRRKLLGNEHLDVAESLSNLSFLLRGERKLSEAETTAREALAICKKLLGDEHTSVAAALHLLAWNLNVQGKHAEAETLSREELAIYKKLLGNENRNVVSTLQDLAIFLADQGKWTEAEAVTGEVLAIRRKVLGDENPDVAYALYHLSWVLYHQGKRAEAEALSREVLAMRRKLLGNEHPDVATTLHKLAIYLRDQGKSSEAETTIREALAIQRKRLGNDHPDVANSLNLLSGLLRAQGKLPEAETTAREALAMQKKLLGTEHLDLAHSLNLLGDVLRQQRKWVEAEAAIHELLAMRRKLLGNEHPDVAATLVDLAVSLRAQGKLPEAETTIREAAQKCHTALAQYEKLASDRNRHQECWSFAISYEALGQLLKDIGQTQEAEKAYRDTQVLWRKLVADFNIEDDRWHLAINFDALGNLLREAGRPTESLGAYRDARAVWLRLVADFNAEDRRYHLACTDEALGQLLKEAGRFDEATEAYRQALAVWKKLVAEFNKDDYRNHLSWTLVSFDAALVALAQVLQQEGKLAEAEAVYRELLALRRKLPADDPQLAVALEGLTRTLLAGQKSAEAEPLARECLTISEKKLPDDWQTFNARSMLGISLLGQKKYTEAEPSLLSGYEGMKQREDKIPADSKRYLKETLQLLVQLYEATGQSEKAAEWNKKLAEFDEAEAAKKTAAPKP